ncbi:hypothetical protein GG344DRAFT_69020 [Lentinula edodes]|nr:hypothetical protein GG344DRAFT_69020 [Lentinula edodes]
MEPSLSQSRTEEPLRFSPVEKSILAEGEIESLNSQIEKLTHNEDEVALLASVSDILPPAHRIPIEILSEIFELVCYPNHGRFYPQFDVVRTTTSLSQGENNSNWSDEEELETYSEYKSLVQEVHYLLDQILDHRHYLVDRIRSLKLIGDPIFFTPFFVLGPFLLRGVERISMQMTRFLARMQFPRDETPGVNLLHILAVPLLEEMTLILGYVEFHDFSRDLTALQGNSPTSNLKSLTLEMNWTFKAIDATDLASVLLLFPTITSFRLFGIQSDMNPLFQAMTYQNSNDDSVTLLPMILNLELEYRKRTNYPSELISMILSRSWLNGHQPQTDAGLVARLQQKTDEHLGFLMLLYFTADIKMTKIKLF